MTPEELLKKVVDVVNAQRKLRCDNKCETCPMNWAVEMGVDNYVLLCDFLNTLHDEMYAAMDGEGD